MKDLELGNQIQSINTGANSQLSSRLSLLRKEKDGDESKMRQSEKEKEEGGASIY